MSSLQNPVDIMAGNWPGLRMHQPLGPLVLGDWRILRSADAVAGTRRYVRTLTACTIGCSSLSSDVELMVGELLANAVEHGGGDTARVRVTADQQTVRVEVHDEGTKPAEHSTTVDPLAERGRGLLIVAAFASRWGLDHDTRGTVAWFEIEP